MKCKHNVSVSLVFGLVMIFILSISSHLHGVTYNPMDFTTVISNPAVTVQNVKGKTVFLSDYFFSFPGRPRLPIQAYYFILPENADLKSVKVVLQEVKEKEIPGTWEVNPVGPFLIGKEIVWPQGLKILNGKDTAVYSRDAFFPAQYFGELRTGKIRRFKTAGVQFFPYRYNPITKKLLQIVSGKLSLDFNPDPTYVPLKNQKAFSMADIKSFFNIKKRACNTKSFAGSGAFGNYYPSFISIPYLDIIIQAKKFPPLTFIMPLPKRCYIILTLNSIVTGPPFASQQLLPFIRAREACNFDVTLVTEDKTYKRTDNRLTVKANEGWGGGTGQPGAEQIRTWLKTPINGLERYDAWDIEYLLLIGCPDPSNGDLPMKSTFPLYELNRGLSTQNLNVPTDYYFAELTSDWNSATPGKDGVLNAASLYPFDLGPEISVARISVPVIDNKIQMLDVILGKLITYVNELRSQSDWRKNVLLPMKPTSFDYLSFPLGERIKAICQAYNFRYHRIYDVLSFYLMDKEFEDKVLAARASGAITEAQATQMRTDYAAMKQGFPDPWDANPENWRQVVNQFPILGLDFNKGFTQAPPDDDPFNDNGNPAAFNESIVRQAWGREDFGLVVWKTHGTHEKAKYVFEIANGELDNNRRLAYVFMGSCLNACPQTWWNHGYNVSCSLLHRGGIGTMAATQNILGGENFEIVDTWCENFIGGELCGGDARNFTVTDLAAIKVGYNFIAINPFGDPALGIYTYNPR
ncbi:MAG: C25 family cysteine peptidase [Candidatus Aminicenantes bacterium]|nr:C25 family cysteine peptidase [Candidatus Aminicenantes bacterium]